MAKTQDLEEKKFVKALSWLTLSEAQEKKAKLLAKNTFKTFSEVDEKSQTYSEKTEAFWEKIKTPLFSLQNLLAWGLERLEG